MVFLKCWNFPSKLSYLSANTADSKAWLERCMEDGLEPDRSDPLDLRLESPESSPDLKILRFTKWQWGQWFKFYQNPLGMPQQAPKAFEVSHPTVVSAGKVSGHCSSPGSVSVKQRWRSSNTKIRDATVRMYVMYPYCTQCIHMNIRTYNHIHVHIHISSTCTYTYF